MGDTIGAFRAWVKKYNALLLKISALLFGVCYILSYKGGISDNPGFMAVSLAMLVLANALAAVIK